nr:DNA-directed RNA polymerase subunit omega [uncultured Blautia sp.]
MIHPSYTELIQAINNNAEEDDNTMMLNSRYSLVLATSKRARQLIAGAEPLVSGTAGKKPLAIAIDELYKGQVKIVATGEENEEETKATASAVTDEAVTEEVSETPEETTEENTEI